MTTLSDVLKPHQPVSQPNAVGYGRVYGNEMTLMERREAPLTWMTPYYRPESMVVLPEARVLEREPLRMGTKMKELRSEEMTLFGTRKYKEARPLAREYTDRIREMFEAEQREAEKNRVEFRKRRWWHRQADITLRDPVKALRYNNLFIAPPDLMNTKDIVTLQLTGCMVGDEAMPWVAAFMQQSYTLRRINLQANNITAAGCKDLVEGIRNCKTLTEFDISLNPIGDDGCNSICVALLDSGFGKASKVYSVNMSTCRLTSSAGHSLARLVRESKSIESLCLWRNELGELIPGDKSAALKMLDELVVNPNTALRIIDLTANGLMDHDLSAHCRALEANLRKNRLQDIEKKHIVERLQQTRNIHAEKKLNAVWEDEKIEVKRLEKEIAADLARIEAYRRVEERNQTREKKLDEKFLSDVQRHTGGLEINATPRRIRLVINGNFSIQPTTISRLKEYYDVSPIQNIDLFVHMPRRHADLINYRRQVGDPYETRDHTAYDAHDIFKWNGDKYDPEKEHRRRVAMAEYREEQQEKRARAMPVHFDKFRLNIHGSEEDLRTKKAHVGISVASGVNARVKETLDEDEAKGTGAKAEARLAKLKEEAAERARAAGEDPSSVRVIRRQGPEQVVYVEVDEEGNAQQHVVEEGNVTIDFSNHNSNVKPAHLVDEEHETEAQRVAKEAQERIDARRREVRLHLGRKSQIAINNPAVAELASGSEASNGQSPRILSPTLKSPRFMIGGKDGGGMPRPSIASASWELPRGSIGWASGGGGSIAADTSSNVTTPPVTPRKSTMYIPSEIPQALRSMRRSTIGRPVTPPALEEEGDGESRPPTAKAASTSGDGLAATENIIMVPSAAALAVLAADKDTSNPFRAFSPKILTATATDAASIADPEERLGACIALIYEGWSEVRRRAEVGSPSDEELKLLAAAEKNVADLKKALSDAIVVQKAFGKSGLPFTNTDHAEMISTFLEDIIKETDNAPNNVMLLDALLQIVPTHNTTANAEEEGGSAFSLPSLINERALIGISASDGSEQFLARLLTLGVNKDGMDVMEIFCSCYYNGLERVPLTKLVVDNCAEKNSTIAAIIREDETLRADLATITQEFFEDVASEKKAMSRESRQGKLELLAAFLDSELLAPMISLEREAGGDRHTVISRALYEGDLPLLKMLLGNPKYKALITNPNLVKSDNLSLLMMAVIGNKPDVVDYFLSSFGKAVDVDMAVRADVGAAPTTAMDMAINLQRDKKIVEVLRAHGATLVGDQIAKGTVAGGKMTVEVSTKGGHAKTAAATASAHQAKVPAVSGKRGSIATTKKVVNTSKK